MRLIEHVKEVYAGNVSAFARAVGRPQSTARKWLLPPDHPDRTLPDEASIVRIYLKSGGAVTPNDIYHLPKLRRRNGHCRGQA